MRLSGQVKSITYVKNNASEIMDRLVENRQPLVITQNGEAKAVLIDVHHYDEQMNTIAMLKRLVLSAQERKQGLYRSVDDAFDNILQSDSEG